MMLVYATLCKKLDIRYRILYVYFEFTHQESHLRNEPVSHCAYFEYPQPHHVRLGFTKQCLRIPLCDTLHRIRLGTHSDSVHSWILNLLQSKTYTYNNNNIQRSNSAAIEERLHCCSSTRCTSCSAIHCNATTGELRVELASTSNCFPSEQL